MRGVQQRLRVGQAGVLCLQIIPFRRTRCQFVHFTNLPGQALAFTLQGTLGVTCMGQCLLCFAPGDPPFQQGLGVDARIRVQQSTHGLGLGQALPGVLAMDVEQLAGGFTQLGCSGRAAVDPGAAFALGVDSAPQQQGGGAVVGCGLVKTRIHKPALECGGTVELGADIGAGRTLAHNPCIGPGTERQL